MQVIDEADEDLGMKIVYMGTPDFAVGPLEAIIAAGHEVVAVVTQPDRPKGRSGNLAASPVKEVALKYGIPVLQPVKIRLPESVGELKQYPADIFVVAAFGQILSEEILEMPKFGCVNIHASLLPHLRGASPIQQSILLGDEKSGVTIMKMDKGLDTGDILIQEAIPIESSDTGGSLFDKLAKLGAELIVKALPLIESGQLTPIPQDDDRADYAGMLKKSMGNIDFNLSAEEIERRVRGLDPWPGAYTSYKGKQLKIWHSSLVRELPEDMAEASDKGMDLPGMIAGISRDAIYVVTGKDYLKIDELQLEGKKRMAVKSFLLGYEMKKGERLGEVNG